MLDLRKDLYARLVISAQKDRRLNRPFRPGANVPIVRPSTTIPGLKIHTPEPMKKIEEKESAPVIFPESGTYTTEHPKSIEEKIAKIPLQYPLRALPAKIVHKEKIDERVVDMISDPKFLEIRKDIEDAQRALAKIKYFDRDNPKIPRIEQTISRLKNLLEQKSYI
jgi:hypothetical protein